jgi:hypothetical protein
MPPEPASDPGFEKLGFYIIWERGPILRKHNIKFRLERKEKKKKQKKNP